MRKSTIILAAIFSFFYPLLWAQNSTYTEVGLAHFYGDYLEGRTTAYGEIYRSTELTCAHLNYPPGTLLRVTRLDNQKSVIVRVNDRGPFIEGYVVDLSKAAAFQLDLLRTGSARVKVEVAGADSPIQHAYTLPRQESSYITDELTSANYRGPQRRTPELAAGASLNVKSPTGYEYYPTGSGTAANQAGIRPDEGFQVNAGSRIISSSPPVADQGRTTGYGQPTAYGYVGDLQARAPQTPPAAPVTASQELRYLPANQQGYVLQLASYREYANAQRQLLSWQGKGVPYLYLMEGTDNKSQKLIRIVLGPFTAHEPAQQYLERVRRDYLLDGIVIRLR